MITNKDQKYFSLANDLCKLSDFRPERVGCVITLKNEVISVGYNTRKTHPFQAKHSTKAGNKLAICMHAETSAIIKIMHSGVNFSRVKIYVYRQGMTGNKLLARPCKICMGMIKSLGIRNIYYSTNNGYAFEKLD